MLDSCMGLQDCLQTPVSTWSQQLPQLGKLQIIVEHSNVAVYRMIDN